MRALVVYESMYGNTHLVADAIGRGLAPLGDVSVVPVHDATGIDLAEVDLVVVGGPTHVHTMSRSRTRAAAVEAAAKDETLEAEPEADAAGVREWLAGLGDAPSKRVRAAAFDTRIDAPALLTGRASKAIDRALRHHGFEIVVEPESFLVTKHNQLEPDEDVRAREWGARLASKVAIGTSG